MWNRNEKTIINETSTWIGGERDVLRSKQIK
jgi:hypothetical protein